MQEKCLNGLVMAVFVSFASGCAGSGDSSPARTTDSTPDTTDSSPTETDPATADVDQDGVSVADGDCDDFNNRVFPGARERSHDGLDSDCDGDDLPSGGTDRYADALALLDTDADGAISFDEFDRACTSAAMVFGSANPGVVQTHSDCGGTNLCRGMVLHAWNELYEHDCRGVNGCAGWSCVETADDAGRDGETVFAEAQCNWCHTGDNGAFLVKVPEGEDVDTWVDGFFARSDEQFRSAISFGVQGIDDNGVAWSNMPRHYEVLSRAEIDRVIAHIRTMPLEAPE